MSRWNGTWGVLDLVEKKDVESHPTKSEAMKAVDDLNELELYARRYKKYGVTPLTAKRLEELRAQDTQK